jgi:hypothetical protein
MPFKFPRVSAALLSVPMAALAMAGVWSGLTPETRATVLLKSGLSRGCAYGLMREQEAGDESECISRKHPEPYREFALSRQRRLAAVSAPYAQAPLPGAFRAAVAQKAAMTTGANSGIVNADATWKPYGSDTRLIVNDPRYSSVSGDGYVFNSGRIDSFDYDPVGKRLFASLGTGGIWMSLDKGQHWVSVGETLPSQVVGSVAWSSFGGAAGSGGTIVVASGDPSFGGGDYAGLGAFWSDDLGVSWHQATGVPDGVLGFKATVDHKNPNIVYLALSKGLFRSTDGGRSYVNVALPTSKECAGNTDVGSKCQFANFVTDVAVMEPGGTTHEAGGKVLAAVGYRAGQRALADGTISSPGNGLYASPDGAPGSFVKLSNSTTNTLLPNGFAVQERIGRIALGAALGPAQNHNYLYAMVQDAVLFNGGFPTLDLPEPLAGALGGVLPVPATSSLFNGLYVSADFGQTWIRAADTNEIANDPTSGSAIVLIGAATSYAPGVQAYYNLYVKPSPVSQDSSGVPTSLVFGLEEVWANRLPVPQNGVLQSAPVGDYQVIGVYRTSTSANTAVTGGTTTHPDQHAAIWIPDDDGAGGATLVVGNDGGVYAQHVAAGAQPSQANWGDGAQVGLNTLLPYGIAVAKDGVVWFGLQDNGSGKVDTDGKYYETYGGDGFYVTVDPDNSQYAWEEYTNGDMRYTLDGGQNWTSNAPTLTGANFDNLFVMDPTDAKHMMTAANQVMELTNAPGGSWVQVFSLGTNATNSQNNIMSTLELQGDSAYVGFCGICDLLNRTQYQFHNGLATNVGGDKPAKRGTGDGWHFAKAQGLPNRYLQAIAIDPDDPKTVYVALGGYANRQWVPPGSYLDTNANLGSGHVFKSTDAGEHFVDVSGNLPDANATALKLRKGQLIVGMDVGAFISSDTAGSSWTPLGSGLPNVPIGQFQLMPGDDRHLFVATYGRGIYHTMLSDIPGSGSGGSGGGSGSGSGSGSGNTSVGNTGGQPPRGRFGGAPGLALLLPLMLIGLRRRR